MVINLKFVRGENREMARKKMAIISSYNESCGNASYTEVLRREFQKYYDVDVLALPQNLLRSNYALVAKEGDKYIHDMANKLKNYDYVNIQFEAGLFGNSRGVILRRFKILVQNSKNLIVTMHRVDLPRNVITKSVIKSIMHFRILQAYQEIRNNRFMNLYQNVVELVKQKGSSASIIVHTKREKDNLQNIFGYQNVSDFPITFLNYDQRQRNRTETDRKNFLEKYGFKENDIVIGLFGFVSAYKSAETVLYALNFLPANYKVAIFGKQHPMSIQENTQVDSYIKSLMNIIEDKTIPMVDQMDLKINAEVQKIKLKNAELEENLSKLTEDKLALSFDHRVFFEGELNDDDFIDALYGCDFAVLPYIETNQSGSGIASLVLETKVKSLFSSSKAFSELQRYYPDCFESFDIGNYIELADKIIKYNHHFECKIEECMKVYNIENNVKNHVAHFEAQDK